MSQYPSPYSPPQLPYASPAGSGGPTGASHARKVAILLYVIGGIGVAMGLCIGSLTWMLPADQMHVFVDQMARTQQIPQSVASPEQFVRKDCTEKGVFMFVGGCVLLILGYFVRRANKAATIAAVIFCGLATLIVVLNIAMGAALGLGGNPTALAGGCMCLVPLSLFGLAVLWLVQLLRALPGIEANRRHYQSQYFQSQQQQAFFNVNQTAGPSAYPGYGGYLPPPQAPGAPSYGQGYAVPPPVSPSPALQHPTQPGDKKTDDLPPRAS